MTSFLPFSSALRRTPPCMAWLGAGLALLLAAAAAQARPLGAQGENFLYQVESGDTLEALARRYTRDPGNWRALQALNQVADPYRLSIDRILRIPLALIPRQAARALVTHVHGQVSRDGKTLQVGDTLGTGDILRTGQGSATLSLEDRSLLTIAPNSEVRVRNLQTFHGTGLTDTVLDLPHGSVESSVAPEDTGVGRFEIRTPATVTGVRGTQLRVHAGKAGSRHEVLHGEAAIRNPAQAEQRLAQDHGAAYDTSGAWLGTQALLPAPVLQPPEPGASSLAWTPVPGSTAYRVRIALDPAGTQLESSRQVTQARIPLDMSGSGFRYLFVRAIDALGIEGSDAMLRIRITNSLISPDGRPVLSGDGTPISLGNG
ncbi:FecR family protein [Castellaniella sp.]|uniref:FecR family protein n=1 Tax=Castellaniella sp. TaxID=1955812 RepID=UPI003C78652C